MIFSQSGAENRMPLKEHCVAPDDQFEDHCCIELLQELFSNMRHLSLLLSCSSSFLSISDPFRVSSAACETQ